MYVPGAVVASRKAPPRLPALFLLKGDFESLCEVLFGKIIKYCFFPCFYQDDPQQALILEVIRNDKLRQIERQK